MLCPHATRLASCCAHAASAVDLLSHLQRTRGLSRINSLATRLVCEPWWFYGRTCAAGARRRACARLTMPRRCPRRSLRGKPGGSLAPRQHAMTSRAPVRGGRGGFGQASRRTAVGREPLDEVVDIVAAAEVRDGREPRPLRAPFDADVEERQPGPRHEQMVRAVRARLRREADAAHLRGSRQLVAPFHCALGPARNEARCVSTPAARASPASLGSTSRPCRAAPPRQPSRGTSARPSRAPRGCGRGCPARRQRA